MDNIESIINRFEELLKVDGKDFLKTETETLRQEFYKLIEKRKEEEYKKHLAEGGEEEEYSAPEYEEESKFKALITQFNEKRKAIKDAILEVEKKNLEAKKALIKELENLVSQEENIGQLFASFKEVQEKWKTIGNIAPKHYKEIQTEYQKLVEEFYYNVSIYKELKMHDLKKNYELKEELIAKAESLLEEKSIRKVSDEIKSIQEKWYETGPSPKENFLDQRNKFWETVRQVFQKVSDYYKLVKTQNKEKLLLKATLLEEVKLIVKKEKKGIKDWNESRDLMVAIREKWNEIGFTSGKESDFIWAKFKEQSDEFFGSRRNFFSSKKEENTNNEKKKLELITKAENLKTDNDWKTTTEKFIKLQQDWKKIGAASPKIDHQLWLKFKATCDDFFNAKKEHFSAMKEDEKENLVKKLALIKEVESHTLSGDKNKDLDDLKAFSEKWKAIGYVPRQDANKVNDAFSKSLDSHYSKIKIDKKERVMISFSNKIEGLLGSNDSEKLIHGEKRNIREKIEKLQKEIVRIETNLGFFANTKNANSVTKGFEQEVEKSKAEILLQKEKLQLIGKMQRQREKEEAN